MKGELTMFNRIKYRIGYFLGSFTTFVGIVLFIMPITLFARIFCTQETRNKIADWIDSR